MRFGVFISVLLHLAIVGMAFISLPFSWRPNVEAEPVIPLELIADAELALKTSVPAARPEPEEIEEPEPDLPEPEVEETPEPAEEIEPEPAPVEPEPEVEEPEPEPEPLAPEPEPDPEPVEETPPVRQPEPENDELDLDALSQLIDKERENEQAATPRETPSETAMEADRPRAAIGAGDRLSASVIAKMQSAVQPCWNAGSIIGAPDPEKLLVTLVFELNKDGTIVSTPRVENALQINLSGNQFWKVAEREAVAAVTKCAPYDFLPVDQYETWKDMRLNFDPSQMVGR